MITERRFTYDYPIRTLPFYEGRMSAKRLIPEKELKACYGLLFADYPDVVTVRQLQTMLGISRHAAYDLLGEGEIGALKLGNAYKIPKINVIRYLLTNAQGAGFAGQDLQSES